VFTNTLRPELDPNTVVYFDVEQLREEAEKVFEELGFQPA
jgi:hypothetical protein